MFRLLVVVFFNITLLGWGEGAESEEGGGGGCGLEGKIPENAILWKAEQGCRGDAEKKCVFAQCDPRVCASQQSFFCIDSAAVAITANLHDIQWSFPYGQQAQEDTSARK